MKQHYQILLIEDSPDDAELISFALRASGLESTWERVESAESLRAALIAKPWDAVLSDYTMPGFGAAAALKIVRAFDADLPFMVVSGTVGEEVAVGMMHAGANDYFLKHALTRLVPAIEREVREAANRRLKRDAERAVQQLAAVVDSSEDAILSRAIDGQVLSWNRSAERLFGYTAEEVLGRAGFLVPPHLAAETRERDIRVCQGEHFPPFESVRLKKGGEPIPVSVSVSAIWFDGQIVGASAIYRDISRQKEAEAEVQKARAEAEFHLARLRAVVANMSEGLIVSDPDGNLLDFNEAALRIHQRDSVEEVRQPLAWFAAAYELRSIDGPLIPFSDWPLARVLRGETFSNWEVCLRRLDIDWERIVSYSGTPILGPNGEMQLAVLTLHDITERKRNEKSQALLAAVVDSSEDAILCTDLDGRIQSWNGAAERLFGYTAEEVLGRADIIVPPNHYSEVRERDDRIRRGEYIPPFEAVRLRKGGEPVSVSITLSAVRVGGKVVSKSAIYRDITEKKRAEDKLRLFRTLIDQTPDGIEVIDPDTGRFLDANERTCHAHGYTREEFLQLSVGDIDPLLANRSWQSLIDEGRFNAPQLFESTHQRRDGTTFPVEVSHDTIKLDRNYLIAVVRDITERKQNEAALRSSEERFREFMNHTPAAADIKDEEGRFLYVNAAWRKQFDAGKNDWEGKTNYDFWPRETADLFRASDLDCLARGTVIQTEETALTASGEKLTKLVMKFPLTDGGQRRIGGMSWDITDRKRVEDALLLRDRAIGAATQGIAITDAERPDNPMIYVSPGFERITGYASEEVLGLNCRFLQGKDTDPAPVARIREAVRLGQSSTVEILNYRKDSTPFWNELSISPVRDAAGRLTHFVGVMSDVTARRRLQEQFRQAQKMEAIGQLAGGVAHDFNNMLTIINGYSDLLLQTLPPEDSSREMIAEIYDAGERSAGLTRQLLAFSRQQILAPRVLSLNEVVQDTSKILRRLIGEDIRLATVLDPNLGLVRADQGQLEQVIINLAVNARDAMITGGKITIETRNVELTEESLINDLDAKPGSYVLLSLTDTGSGMTPEVKAKIFEPFFTTKGPGKGTGLGLATVFGIVKQSNGRISVYSELGVGTSFKIYLPRVAAEDEALLPRSGLRAPLQGTETILLVEDEAAVRALSSRILTKYGYTVLEASDGDEAVRLAVAHKGIIHLILTDVVLPGVGGRAVAETVAESHPEAKVMFLSGYTDDAIIRHGILRDGVHFLQKPFTPLALSSKVRQVLDEKA